MLKSQQLCKDCHGNPCLLLKEVKLQNFTPEIFPKKFVKKKGHFRACEDHESCLRCFFVFSACFGLIDIVSETFYALQ
jgi:hypothetical protein